MRKALRYLAVAVGAATPIGWYWERVRRPRVGQTPRQRVEKAIDDVMWLRLAEDGVRQGDTETPRASHV
jgi:hypothetical protein